MATKVAALKVDIVDGELLECPIEVYVNPLKVTLIGREMHRFAASCCGGYREITAYYFKNGLRFYGIIGWTEEDGAALIASYGETDSRAIAGALPE